MGQLRAAIPPVLAVLLLVGCAGTTHPLRMALPGQPAERADTAWYEGIRMLQAGDELWNRGFDQLRYGLADPTEGRGLMREGQQLIAEGARMMERGEKAQTARFPAPDLYPWALVNNER